MEKIKSQLYNALRRGERYAKTDLVYLAKGGFWLSLGQGVAMLSGFLLSLAFANLFPKESFGTYKFVLATAGILGAFSLTGLNTSVVQSVARGFGSSLRRGFRINLRWSVLVCLGGLALSIYYYVNGDALLSFSFMLVGTLSPITDSASLYGAYLLGKKDFRRNSSYGMINNVIPAASLILTLLLTRSFPIIISVYFLSTSLTPLILYRMARRAYWYEGGEDDPGLLSYGGHLSVMEIIGTIASSFDKILIFHYLGAAPLAIYAFAIAPVEQLQGGKKILSTLVMPKLSERPFEELQESAPRKALLLTAYALGLAGVYALLAPYFYKFLYPQYLDSVFYSQIYSLTLLAISGTIFNETLVAHKKKKELYLYRTITPVVQIMLFFILLPLYGLMGLIITHVFIRSFNALLGYYFVMHPFNSTSSS